MKKGDFAGSLHLRRVCTCTNVRVFPTKAGAVDTHRICGIPTEIWDCKEMLGVNLKAELWRDRPAQLPYGHVFC